MKTLSDYLSVERYRHRYLRVFRCVFNCAHPRGYYRVDHTLRRRHRSVPHAVLVVAVRYRHCALLHGAALENARLAKHENQVQVYRKAWSVQRW